MKIEKALDALLQEATPEIVSEITGYCNNMVFHLEAIKQNAKSLDTSLKQAKVKLFVVPPDALFDDIDSLATDVSGLIDELKSQDTEQFVEEPEEEAEQEEIPSGPIESPIGKEKPTLNIDPTIFGRGGLMLRVSNALRQAGYTDEEVSEFKDDVKSIPEDQLLSAISDWVNIVH